jgi:hypothetical protein
LVRANVFTGNEPLEWKQNAISKRQELSSDGRDLFWAFAHGGVEVKIPRSMCEREREKTRKIDSAFQKAPIQNKRSLTNNSFFLQFPSFALSFQENVSAFCSGSLWR